LEPRRLTAAAVLVAALAATSAAHADVAEDRAAARQHLTQAQDLKKQGNLAEALTHFAESQRLDPKLATVLDLADCAEQLGKLVEAQGYWAAARDTAKREEKPQSRARAEQRLAAVEARVVHLTLQLAPTAPAGTQVFRDDVLVEVGSLGVAVPVNPGAHAVVVKAAGRQDGRYDVTFPEGDTQNLTVDAGAVIPVNAPPPPPPPPKPVAKVSITEAPSSSGSGQRAVGMILGAGGIVGLGVGGLLWNVGYRNGNSLGPTAGNQMLTGQVLVVTGGVLLVTGVVLFATAPSGSAPQAARLPITPLVALGSHTAVLGAAGEF